jgi:hypothetical protein
MPYVRQKEKNCRYGRAKHTKYFIISSLQYDGIISRVYLSMCCIIKNEKITSAKTSDHLHCRHVVPETYRRRHYSMHHAVEGPGAWLAIPSTHAWPTHTVAHERELSLWDPIKECRTYSRYS